MFEGQLYISSLPTASSKNTFFLSNYKTIIIPKKLIFIQFMTHFMHWRRKWQPTPVFLPGESQGWESFMGCRLWGHRVGHDWSDLAAYASPVYIFSTDLHLEIQACISISSCLLHTSPFVLSFKNVIPDLFTASSFLLFKSQLIWL